MSKQSLESFLSDTEIAQILDRITDGFFAVDKNWRVIYSNKQAQMIANATLAESRGKIMWDFVPHFVGTNIHTKYLEAMGSDHPTSFVEYLPDLQSWWETKLYPSPEGLSIYFRNITEKFEAEKKMKETLSWLTLALHGTNTAVWDCEIGSEKVFNPSIEKEFLGYKSNEVAESWLEALHPDDRKQMDSIFQKFIQKENPKFEVEHRLRHKKGSYRWVLTRGRGLFKAQGECHRIVGVTVDITEQKNVAEKLKKTTEELSRSNKDLEQFAAVAAHDLKEPLRMVGINLELLPKKFPENEKMSGEPLIKDSIQAIRRLSLLIDSLLAYSYAGKGESVFRLVQLDEVVDASIKNLSVIIRESQSKINRPDSLPALLGDEQQLVQLFQNLLSNAIKFRKSQAIPEIQINFEEKADSWIFSVRDNGIGIPADKLDGIFEIFERLHSTSDYPGNGIGLALTKKIVEKHNGRIWADAKLNVGSCFYFSLPKMLEFLPGT